MKSKCVLIAIVFLVAAATAQVPETDVPQKPKRPRAQVYVLEGLGALGGSVACGCLGVGVAGLLGSAVGGFNSDDEWAMWKLVMVGGPVLVVTAAVLPATTAVRSWQARGLLRMGQKAGHTEAHTLVLSSPQD
jgi:hypothetical protein